MLIMANVGNWIKMLNTAAKQSPGKDANTFMLITEEEREDGEKNRKKGCWSAQSASEADGEWEPRGREIKREKGEKIKSWLPCEWVLGFSEDEEEGQRDEACF